MYRSFVALGDSFTEGMDDPRGDGTFRGWADLVAEQLAEEVHDFRYANLAIRGRLVRSIVAEQLGPALSMRPELVSIAGGGNDVLRGRVDYGAVSADLAGAVQRLRDAGATVVMFTTADLTRRWPGGQRVVPRLVALNEVVRQVAADCEAVLVDLWRDDMFHDGRMWSEDRLHLSPLGHHRVAAHALELLGVPPRPTWRPELPPVTGVPWARARIEDVLWARRHLAPWVTRRLRGRSSGDLISPKRPSLEPYAPGPGPV
jgi:lysophospholipase L1-like esterase